MTMTDSSGQGNFATKRVLVVDDEADIRELVVLTLMRMGIEADSADNVAHATARLAERAYDLCLTDMRLPDGDGLMLLSHIAGKYGNTPVAVITAYGSTDNAVAALKAGAFDYLSKPIQLKQLREVVTAALSLPRTSEQTRKTSAASNERTNAATNEINNLGPQLIGESAPIVRAREMIATRTRAAAAGEQH